MSQMKPFIGQKNSFHIQRTTPRKAQSRSPLKLDSKQFNREFGPKLETIDVHVGNLRWALDLKTGIWMPVAITTANEFELNNQNKDDLQRKKSELEKENSLLSAKLDILLEMLAQTTAEEELVEDEELTTEEEQTDQTQ